jgi:hypothetical protein
MQGVSEITPLVKMSYIPLYRNISQNLKLTLKPKKNNHAISPQDFENVGVQKMAGVRFLIEICLYNPELHYLLEIEELKGS